MSQSHRVVRAVIAAALATSAGAWAAQASPSRGPGGLVAVSPGGSDAFLAAEACPTFGWAAAAASEGGYELVVYPAEDPAAGPALEARLPAGALVWTPPADRCLPPGRYAWSVRAVGAAQSWSEALLFQVRELPTEGEYRAALELVQRYLATNPAAAEDGPRPAPAASPSAPPPADLAPTQNDSDATEQGAGVDAAAVRGDILGAAGPNFGLLGISHSPDGAGVSAENTAGPDLRLMGSPPALLSETGLTRSSAGALTFDFANTGGGLMTLRVDGEDVVTTTTDQDTLATLGCDEGDFTQFLSGNWDCVPPPGGGGGGGDAETLDGLDSLQFLRSDVADGMNGTLTLASGDLALHSSAEVTKGGERFLWDDPSSGSFGAGRGALASNTAGFHNTAVGTDALSANTVGIYNTATGARALQYNTLGGANTASGYVALFQNTTGSFNTATGMNAMASNTGGSGNTAVGAQALSFNSTGNHNTAAGRAALANSTTGSYNTAIGRNAMWNTGVGSYNIALGDKAGYDAYGSSNILIGNEGYTESNTLRLGTHGSGAGQQNRAFIAGISGTNLAGAAMPVFIDADGQLGTSAAFVTGLEEAHDHGFLVGNTRIGLGALVFNTSGERNTALGDSALISNTTGSRNTAGGYRALSSNTTASYNTAFGHQALSANTSGAYNTAIGERALVSNTTGLVNTAVGQVALSANTTGGGNTATGYAALSGNTTGSGNTANGSQALQSNGGGFANTAVGNAALFGNTTGDWNTATGREALRNNTIGLLNTAIGYRAMFSNTTGYDNTALGEKALYYNTVGGRNTALGAAAGLNTTGFDNILIGHLGVAAENNTLRIGQTGSSGGQQNRAFIAAIRGTTTGAADAIPVLIDSNGQLGTASSSRRLKQDIEEIAGESARLLALRPVKFRYKVHATQGDPTLQYGLIAEEVAEVFPELVVYDAEGRPETVRYHLLAPLLLSELQREHALWEEERRRNVEQEKGIRALLARLDVLEGEREAPP
jgi:hypothetical protein